VIPEGFRFLDPWFLAATSIAIALFVWRVTGSRDAALGTASLRPASTLPATLRTRLVRLPETLRLVALLALGVALARPVTRDVLPISDLGVDIVLVLDVSSSMRANDMDAEGRILRIQAAREKAMEFAASRRTDRVGVVTFALFPDLRCPLTLDLDARAAFLRSIDTVERGSQEDRTGIGAGLAKAVAVLKGSAAKSRIVVLLSDGDENVREIEPEAAAKLAKDADVRVHTIGLGAGRRMNLLGSVVVQPTDFSTLEAIANATGGKFFEATDAEGLGAVYAAIDEMEKVPLEDPRYRTVDWFLWPLAVAAVALAAALFAQFVWLRRAP
jgi:Ca-activated chloride channel family protein